MALKPIRRLLQLTKNLSWFLTGLVLLLHVDGVAYAQSFPATMIPTQHKLDQGSPDSATPNDATVFLSAKVNGNPDIDVLPFTERGQQLYLSKETATQLGFSADFLKSVSASTPLDAYPGVKADYNRSQQSVSITAPFSILSLDTAVVGGAGGAPTFASASPGLLLNYDLYSTYTNQTDASLSSFMELRGFNNLGVLSSSYLLQGQRIHDQPGLQRTTVRLDTTFQHSFQDKEITFRLGDAITNGLSWTRQTRIGGFQLARNFSLQPYKTTTPLPAYFGSAALPSAVELFVNGIQQYNGRVPAGPFELKTLPVVNGAGQAQVVLTDALGRRTAIDFPFYNSTRLLRKGLTDWSFETGYVRKDYGFRSFEYSQDPMASATLRHGLTDWLTAEAHAEGSKGAAAGGVGAVATLGMLGTVSGSWAQGQAQGAKGAQYSAGYQLQRGPFSLGGSTQRTAGNYRDVSSLYGSTPVLRSDNAYVGYDMRKWGNVALNYVQLQLADQPRYRYGGASWSRAFPYGVSVSLSANQNLDVRSDRSIYLNVSFNLGKGTSAYTSAVRSSEASSYSIGMQRSAPSADGWSWNIQAEKSDQQPINANGQVSKRTQYLDFNAGISGAGNNQYAYAGASGSIAAMGGGVFASRRIHDAFAVVSTDGVPDVPIMNQNRLVGATNSRGLALVPSLQSYQHNKISLDPTNLPINMRIDQVNTDVTPHYRSGVNIRFAMQAVHAASLILHGPDGRVVPMGAQVFLNNGQEPTGWVGYDGRLYLEGLHADNHLAVRGDTLNCTVRFSYQAKADSVPELGPLQCKP